ncbi:hypothetical protein [Actibacterium lipolyticum]|uniref:Transferrin-binding protein B C-lobe/N-lobe beta barrel domain-containing protein n=1 Tax=Actibacterium lipolyticum TaxID=1524263 RepID=A0A238JR21_9RHOB|nr:hypothetical protein [Actibacterium lipolyticum]SMX32913.1 hypothetical protein COL8621_00918 [Actibacterium lipolyticum]
MLRILSILMACTALTACSGGDGTNPINGDGGSSGGGSTGGTGGIGDDDASPNASIERYEDDGQARDILYNADDDTFIVDNLAFDGSGVYERDNVVPTVNSFRVYENNNTTERRAYKALYLESTSGLSRVAIVRTGSYQGFGFGGFVYARDGGVDLPSTGSATFTGAYAGMRVFNGAGGLQYTQADAELIVDFEDFDATRAVEGFLTNREVLNQSGAVIDTLPTLIFSTGSITDAGEISGVASSDRFDVDSGEIVDFETGNYYAIIGGAEADEIVGVVVVTADDPDRDNVTIQETGAFIVYETP